MRYRHLWNHYRQLLLLAIGTLLIVSQIVNGTDDNGDQNTERDTAPEDQETQLRSDTPPAKFAHFEPLSNSKQKKKFQLLSTNKKGEFHDGDINTWGSFERHPCRRQCQQNRPLSCYYRLMVHNYRRLGRSCDRCLVDERACEGEQCIYGDGVPTPIMAVNRLQPGPAIEVCENDTVIVDVLNYLTEPTTMHWHGLPMTLTPEMDGAPFTTQYPIQPGEVYRYEFAAERAGTLWYHSHVGLQRGLGVAGSFLIRQSRQRNRQAHLYDYDLVEHTMLIQDIVYNNDFNRVRNILINGKGRNHMNQWPDNDQRNRYERIRISPGYRYRMRIINNGIFDCPIEFSIENHKMLVIGTDGNDIAPIEADSFFMASAERFDFVLNANQYASNYWIRVRGYGDCLTENLYQGAVLHYSGAARNEQPITEMSETQFGRAEQTEHISIGGPLSLHQDVTVINQSKDAQKPPRKTTDVATAALHSLDPLPWSPYTKFLTYYSSFGSRTQSNGETVFQIDDITFQEPDVSLLQARDLYNEEAFLCNRTAMAVAGFNCQRNNCACTNVIRLPAYRPIEIVAVNYDSTPHPLHLHGFTFRVVGQDVLGNSTNLRRIEDLDRQGRLRRTAPDFPAVAKDVVQIPGFGYAIVRFLSNNPGFWMYHCHIELHAVRGMVAILKIGENNQMKRVPPKLRC